MTNQCWQDDPRRLVFLLARYKFVSKMLSGKRSVLEIGCADAFGTRVVLQEVGSVTAVDFDPVFVQDARERMDPEWEFEVKSHDMLRGPVPPGVLILGSPSIHSQAYASKPSLEGHVNCKDAAGMRQLTEKHFRNVFLFSMNDELVHTGFTPMAHYLIAMCVGRK